MADLNDIIRRLHDPIPGLEITSEDAGLIEDALEKRANAHAAAAAQSKWDHPRMAKQEQAKACRDLARRIKDARITYINEGR